jgi:hypothetical protein
VDEIIRCQKIWVKKLEEQKRSFEIDQQKRSSEIAAKLVNDSKNKAILTDAVKGSKWEGKTTKRGIELLSSQVKIKNGEMWF